VEVCISEMRPTLGEVRRYQLSFQTRRSGTATGGAGDPEDRGTATGSPAVERSAASGSNPSKLLWNRTRRAQREVDFARGPRLQGGAGKTPTSPWNRGRRARHSPERGAGGNLRLGRVGKPKISWRDTVIYEAHVKGLTKLNRDDPPEARAVLPRAGQAAGNPPLRSGRHPGGPG